MGFGKRFSERVGFFATIAKDTLCTEFAETGVVDQYKLSATDKQLSGLPWEIIRDNDSVCMRQSIEFASIFYTWTTFTKDPRNSYTLKLKGRES